MEGGKIPRLKIVGGKSTEARGCKIGNQQVGPRLLHSSVSDCGW